MVLEAVNVSLFRGTRFFFRNVWRNGESPEMEILSYFDQTLMTVLNYLNSRVCSEVVSPSQRLVSMLKRVHPRQLSAEGASLCSS